MFARKCDRCGKLYETYMDEGGNAVYQFNRGDDGEALERQVFVKDLCPECMAEFHKFMEGWIPIEKYVFADLKAADKEIGILKAENERLKEKRIPVVLDSAEPEQKDTPLEEPMMYWDT